MRELSLFSGGGGGLLGSKLLGWTTLGYVEWNAYACRLLAQRIADGFLDDAPIYCGDVRDFIRDGYADCYKGVVDVVSAGFPCQEFSLANYMHAGQGTAGTGAKNQWPATIEIIRRAEPRYVLLENVVGLLGSHGYFGRVLSDLASEGYDVRWETISGTEVGAPHVRRRVWIAGVRRWRRVMDAADMLECECCNEPYCPECETHYHECDCPGPSQDDEYDYREVSGILQARPKDVADSNGERCQENRAGAEQFNRNSYPLNAAVAISNGGEKIPQNMGKMINPEWEEWLMGWPVGWTDLKPLETAKFQQWCAKHGTGSRE